MSDTVQAVHVQPRVGVWRERAMRRPSGLLLSAAAVAVLAGLPVVITLVQAIQGGAGAAKTAFTASATPTLFLHTIELAAIATPASGVLGLATAWLVERTRLPGRRIWPLLLVAPLAVPLFVTSYAWATLSPSLTGFWGAAGIVTFSYYPIVFLLVAASLRVMDPALEETARSLGLGAWRTFVRVVLPQLRAALLGGMLLVLLDTLVEFDAFVALKFQTLSVNIYAQYQLGFSAAGAAALSLFSTLICVVVLFGEYRLRGGANYTRISQGARRGVARYRLGRATVPVLIGLALVVAASLGVPLGLLVHWFTQGNGTAGAPAATGTVWSATLTTVLLGAAAGLVAVAMALPVAILAVRRSGAVAITIERSVYLSFALPDLVAAIALAYAASHVAHFLYGTVALLVLAEAMLFVPFAVVALRGTIGLIEPSLEESGRALGLGPLRTVWRVTVPLARPGLAAAGVLVFTFVLGDLGTAQVLLPPGLTTLGTQFWADSGTVAFAAAAPFAAVLVVLALLATYVLMSRFGRARGFGES
ncbi:MAG TPA: iron ABC transporter permease [Solirubrobacteraceae bacterium]|nr:iron ABC transporter permease [Solirubrobacteraceae bacterium]